MRMLAALTLLQADTLAAQYSESYGCNMNNVIYAPYVKLLDSTMSNFASFSPIYIRREISQVSGHLR